MSAVYVIHVGQDQSFADGTLLRPLPALGFDRRLSSATPRDATTASPVALMERSAVILIVVSKSALASPSFVAEAEAALKSNAMVIAVYLEPLNADDHPLLRALGKVGRIDGRAAVGVPEPRDLWRALAELLPPPPGVELTGELDASAMPIGWNEGLFSDLIHESVNRHDYNRSQVLIRSFSAQVHDWLPYGYPEQNLNADLGALREKRQFLLMDRYASAALASGTTDFKVRRQYAQALIELKKFDEAAKVLVPLIEETIAAKHPERFEARGLLGRMYKQRYVDGDRRDGALLRQAIAAYVAAFREDQEQTWSGINAASCILCANRDGVKGMPESDAHTIAKAILDILRDRQKGAEADEAKERMDVWDYATRVEAFVDLEEFDAASKALGEYLVHPDMDAFEVSSTYRQFDEVLLLANDSRGRPLLHRLAEAAARLRSGGLTHVAGTGIKPMLVRVSDPQWAPANIPDLVIHARLGTVVSISGSDRTVKALLKDPLVISVEESRPSGQVECDESLPSVRVAATYQGEGGSFSENGSAALVAIIDNGIDVLHEAFLDANGQSRIIGIWDQQDTNAPASPPPGFDFGRYHTRADVARYVAEKNVPASLSRANNGHGTHVASIAAGRKTDKFFGGVAPQAPLLFVISGGDEPTGYSNAHLAALTFIDKIATDLGKPVVVNLSEGMNAGAHDGKSALEIMFDEFSKGGTKAGRVVVKSAGNERIKRGHAKLTVPSGGGDELIWRCQPGPSRVRLELWWHSANQFRFQLKSPSGDLSDWVELKNPDVEGYFKKRGAFTLKLVRLHPDNGDNLLKVDVDNGVSPIAASDWTLVIEAVKVPAKGDIHAWIERGGGVALTEFVNHDNEEMTLSIPGTSYSVITVGAIATPKPAAAIVVGNFSSFGPTRDGREKPDICAPGVDVKAARRDSGNDIVAMKGTSMAAPHVTGAIALLLSKMARAGGPVPTATQIGAVLRQKTINYSAQWDRGQGYGVLDVAALLEAF